MKAREVKRAKLANRYAHKREEIAAKVKSGEMDHEEAWQALSKLFGISRIQFREMASKGLIPGVTKASW